ncbi:hypothetical protein GALMADRAFT_161844 [Galerina marginata CBS 339.88]|uniref:chitin deacetylase n=1 Tax=Galerina marginata (strain CBS 339.88) TaxID=685588 RepID=A0A067S7S6_GALM3|nr:hypothetical protein GALMADRAFT_161844 [Galerina marginata CBS 339.88]
MLVSAPKPSPRLQTIFALGVVALSVLSVEAQQTTPGRTTEAGEASIKGELKFLVISQSPFPSANRVKYNCGLITRAYPKKECEPYNFQPVTDALASFPIIWQPATIVPEDSNAQAKWAAIQPSVPNIPPKGTLEGNFEGLNYPADDPDCWWTNTKCNNPKTGGIPADVFTMPEPRTLGYGFDDGPNCSHNAFYDYLRSQNQRATMFYVGSNVMDWPLEAQRAVADGHEICIHGWSHRYMTGFESPDAFAELYYSVRAFIPMQAVKIATGVTPTCWRPPYGDVDDRIRAIAHGLGLRTVLWDYDSQDWQVGATAGVTSETVDKEYQVLIDDAKKGKFNNVGAMLLMHEINEFTMTEAMKMYPKLKEAFQHIVPVCVGLNITQPYVENSVTMPNFAQYIAGTGSTLVKNSTNAVTVTATASASSTSSPSTTGDAPGATPQTGDASRLQWMNGMGGIQLIVALVLGFVCAATLGLPN